jgi:16S rRNA (cytosine967-C5)-methyltransferase
VQNVALSPDLIRSLAFETLLRFEKGGADRLKADQLIQAAVNASKNPLSATERGFLQALVMGTLRHWYRLEVWIQALAGRRLKQIEPSVRVLLRMGLFQLYGLHQVPAYAAINTTVELAKQQKKVSPRTIKFINAILREGQRRLEAGSFILPLEPTGVTADGLASEKPENRKRLETLAKQESADLPAYLLNAYGWPDFWTHLLRKQYDPIAMLRMAEISQTPAPLVLRVNTLKLSVAAYLDKLQLADIKAQPLGGELPEGLVLEGLSGSIRELPGYAEGWFYVQDASSMWVSRLLDPQPGEAILDLCAAPGSKTTHMAALSQNQAVITAIDPKKERLALLEENILRLGAAQITLLQVDGLAFEGLASLDKSAESGQTPAQSDDAPLYDKVLVDAPCSGSGTIRRHPEILLHMRKFTPAIFVKQQSALLEKGFSFLRDGGLLVYSTCSLLQTENQAVVQRLLAKHPDARLESEEQRQITETADGFYAARIRKISQPSR